MSSNEFISDMQLEERLQAMNDRQLLEFTARQVYDVTGVVGKHDKRIKVLEGRGKKETGITGGLGAVVGAAVVAVVNYFTGR